MTEKAELKGDIVKKTGLFIIICLAVVLAAVGCGEGSGPAGEIDAEVGVSAAAALTEARIEGVVGSMEVMAVVDEVLSGDWDEMVDVLTTFEESSIPLVAWYALPNGSYYTVDAGKTSANLSDRAYFPRVLAGEIVVGDLVVSKSTGRKVMVAVVPVKSGGAVTGVLGVSVYLDELSRSIVEDMGLPGDMVLYAVNGGGVVALHSDSDMLMEDSSALGGKSEQAVSQSSPFLGWTFTIDFTD
jgi:hypothetical protein